MSAASDLVVFVLRVLSEEIRKRLDAERNLPGKKRDSGKEVRCLADG